MTATYQLVDDLRCGICGNQDIELTLRLIKVVLPRGVMPPNGFEPVSANNRTVHGHVAVCSSCAPPCRRCQEPRPSSATSLMFAKLEGELSRQDAFVAWGDRCIRPQGRWFGHGA